MLSRCLRVFRDEKSIQRWKGELGRAHQRIADCLRARRYGTESWVSDGLLSGCERKNGWQLAECVGDGSPYGMQYLLDRLRWDANAVQARLSEYVQEELGSPDAVLVLTKPDF